MYYRDMENNKMYLTETEAKAKNLPSAQEQIDRYNAALEYVVRGLDADGNVTFYTGRAGAGWVSPNRAESFIYSVDGARAKAMSFNRMTALHGLRFVAAPRVEVK